MQTTNGSDSSLATPGGTTPPPPQQWQQQQQQHWMAAMQYPGAAAMMMMQQQQQMMMYPHQYVPYNYQQHPQFQYASYHQQQEHKTHERGSGDDVKTLWIGDLLHWMDETYLHTCFSHTGEVSSVKVIRNKLTCQSEGYGFVEFLTRAAAEEVLQNFNGSVMPNSEQLFRLNWASFSTGEKRAVENGPELSIFVGDLSPDVTDTLLQELFVERYPSVKSAKVVIDSNTGRSKGYGFVRFGDESERSRALTEMNGAYCSNRQMRVGVATPKRAVANHHPSQDVTDTLLQELFVERYPSVKSAKVVIDSNTGRSKGYGFVRFGDESERSRALTEMNGAYCSNRQMRVGVATPKRAVANHHPSQAVIVAGGHGANGFMAHGSQSDGESNNSTSADDAIQSLNGTVIGKNTVRLSWGRTPNKQVNILLPVDLCLKWRMAHQGERVRALRLTPWRKALALKKLLVNATIDSRTTYATIDSLDWKEFGFIPGLARFTYSAPYARLEYARLLAMARALRNPPSPRRYMAMEPLPDGEETQGSSGMEDTHNEDKVTTMEDMLTTTTPTTILPSLEDKKRINFIMAMVA
ncbi:hypothetical protein F2Q69_00003786 [Brassica cretica]|uniref:RRM domain-containing protein n=1 Tax=Brassica cretica TaxID=69181 RepID=A0A8S9P6Q6_BRACR|nr:hypothetical protein F2Q69_00003786 [Brassica cretica]